MTKESIMQLLSLEENIHTLITRHFEAVGQDSVRDLHKMLLELVEPALLEAVMESCHYKQSKAAKILGLSRATCRTMLIKYFGEKYCGERKKKDI